MPDIGSLKRLIQLQTPVNIDQEKNNKLQITNTKNKSRDLSIDPISIKNIQLIPVRMAVIKKTSNNKC